MVVNNLKGFFLLNVKVTSRIFQVWRSRNTSRQKSIRQEVNSRHMALGVVVRQNFEKKIK